MELIEKVQAAIERENLIPEGMPVAVGVSGGADSVALLHSLNRLGYPLAAAHLNHSLRGAAADADERFVKELCTTLGIECVTQKVDVPALAKEKGLSLEMAAREARHEFFRSLAPNLRPKTATLLIALAHHADDQLETFFLRAARGTGPSGVGGMRYFQKLGAMHLIRPMLGIRRIEISRWLEKEGIEWREDATNTDETIPRNFVRRQLLPLFGKLNDRAAENLLRTMTILRDEADRPELAARRREIRDGLIGQGVSPGFETVERVIEFAEKKNGTQFLDLEGLRLVNEYGLLSVDATSPSHFPRTERDRDVASAFPICIEEGVGILRGPWEASVSRTKVAGRAVSVRASRPGDRMSPYGLDGSKKLQDIFTDLKIPKRRRAGWPVVECGGEIIWLPGYRIARGWELSSPAEPALHLTLAR
ncbi:MAG: tRNA(Ile)-lysidine synthase [Verrucomicrobiota bacterium]|nr:tRNA(Ile)-lysidine synthase [Verrucomicrobiota bacterium]MDK2963786.1 tRNA(Ile)-lysidine synthase [Verrucomicrobiota bacterium]